MSCKWIYAVKRDEQGNFLRCKARLTARGFTQVQGEDFSETWAPTCRLRCFRALLAESASDPKFQTAQWDAKCAFLQSDADCEMYMEQPPGFAQSKTQVYKLLKSVYGTKQASRLFFQLVRRTLLSAGGVQASSDECLFLFKSATGVMRVLVHVDDFCVTYTDPALYTRVLHLMQATFKGGFKDLGTLHHFLGIVVEPRLDGGFRLHQGPKIKELLTRLQFEDIPFARSPEKSGTKEKLRKRRGTASTDEKLMMSQLPYKQAVGALFYLTRATRWDISHAASQVAKFMADPTPLHWAAVQRIYGYLRRTATVGLVIAPKADPQLDGHSDSDWAGDIDTRRSHTGWIVRWGGSLLSWHSKQQSCEAQSTSEAELVAATSLGNELLWWRGLWTDLDHPPSGPTRLWCDNHGAVQLATHACNFNASKHIALRYRVLRRYQEEAWIGVHWVPQAFQWADVLTKNNHPSHFCTVVSAVMGESI